MTFLSKSHFSLKMRHAPAYRALFWLFWPITQCLFTTKIPIKLIFPQIAPIVQGTSLTFFPKKVIFPKKCLHIEYDFDFLPNNLLCFYTTNSQKVHFSSNCSYNTGHFIDFFPKKVIFFSKCGCISSTMLTFLPNNPVCFYTKNSQEFHFSSNCAYHTGHFIDVSPKKSDFFLKMRQHIEHYLNFFAQ